MRVEKYEALCETLISVFVTGCDWGTDDSTNLWVHSLQRIVNPIEIGGGLNYLLSLRRYPALLLLYSAGLAAVAAGNYATLAAVLTKPRVRDAQNKYDAICSKVYPNAMMDVYYGRLLPGQTNRHTPVSDHLYAKLQAPLREFLPGDEDYKGAFDRFEYLLGLVHADMNRRVFFGGWWGPAGRFAWRYDVINPDRHPSQKIGAEIEAERAKWPPLKAGLFGGSLGQLKTAKGEFDKFLRSIRFG